MDADSTRRKTVRPIFRFRLFASENEDLAEVQNLNERVEQGCIAKLATYLRPRGRRMPAAGSF